MGIEFPPKDRRLPDIEPEPEPELPVPQAQEFAERDDLDQHLEELDVAPVNMPLGMEDGWAEIEEPEESGPTPQELVHARSRMRSDARRARLGKAPKQQPELAPEPQPEPPQNVDGEAQGDKVPELLQQLIDAAQTATEAAEAAQEAIKTAGDATVAAIKELQGVIENLGGGLA